MLASDPDTARARVKLLFDAIALKDVRLELAAAREHRVDLPLADALLA